MEKETYEALHDMFASKGWKIFQEDVTNLITGLKDGAAAFADTNDKWQNVRGQLQQLQGVAGYAAFVERVWAEEQAAATADKNDSSNEILI